jgi:hypothetical protein
MLSTFIDVEQYAHVRADLRCDVFGALMPVSRLR